MAFDGLYLICLFFTRFLVSSWVMCSFTTNSYKVTDNRSQITHTSFNDLIISPIKGRSLLWIKKLLTIYQSVHITYFTVSFKDVAKCYSQYTRPHPYLIVNLYFNQNVADFIFNFFNILLLMPICGFGKKDAKFKWKYWKER